MGILVLLLLATFGSMEVGYLWGVQRSRKGQSDVAQLGTIQGAILGLLGLLLGFSFSGAATRFVDRQDLIVQEANAIGTAYLRADLLTDPHAEFLRKTLETYVQDRVSFFQTGTALIEPGLAQRTAQQHRDMWQAALEGVQETSHVAVVVLPAVNDVIDLHTTRIATAHRHLPLLIITLLVVCAALGMLSVGFGCGLSGKRSRLMTSSLALLVCTVLWVTIDLDYPRHGGIQIRQQPLLDLLESFRQP